MPRVLYFFLVLSSVALLCGGCQTPERRTMLDRMNQLQAENSAVKAKAESESAQARMDVVRQKQDELRLIEELNRRMDDLSKKIDAVNAQPRVQAAPPPKPAEPTKEELEAKAELEKVKEQARLEMARVEEQLAKAQAEAETAKAAAAAAERAPKEQASTTGFVGKKLPLVKFIDSSGKLIDISQYEGKKNVVLCVMKGFYSQGICVYCTRQTADLAKNAKGIRDLNAEILVVYPGKEEHINAFVRSVRDYEKSDDPRFQLPFKVLLDVNQDVVRTLGIAGDLANPSSFVIDKQGIVRYQYVGRTISDRPTAPDLANEVKKLGGAP